MHDHDIKVFIVSIKKKKIYYKECCNQTRISSYYLKYIANCVNISNPKKKKKKK